MRTCFGILFCGFLQLSFLFRLAESLQLGNKYQTNEGSGKTTVVQQETTMHIRNGTYQQIVQTGS